MTYISEATARFNRREAIRQMARDSAARNQLPGTPAMRPPQESETPLSPDEVKQGVRDGTFAAPRELKPDNAGRYVTKAPQQRGPGDDDDDDDREAA